MVYPSSSAPRLLWPCGSGTALSTFSVFTYAQNMDVEEFMPPMRQTLNTGGQELMDRWFWDWTKSQSPMWWRNQLPLDSFSIFTLLLTPYFFFPHPSSLLQVHLPDLTSWCEQIATTVVLLWREPRIQHRSYIRGEKIVAGVPICESLFCILGKTSGISH